MHSASAVAGIGGGSSFDHWMPATPDVRVTRPHVYGRSLVSDQIPAICACSPIVRQHWPKVPRLLWCCTGAPKPQRDTISGLDGRPSQIATVLRYFCPNSSDPTIPTVVSTGFSPTTADEITGSLFRFGR